MWFGLGQLLACYKTQKFTAGLLVPLFALVIFIYAIYWLVNLRRKEVFLSRRSPIIIFTIGYPLIAFFTLWAAYGFQIGVMPSNLPTMPQLAGMTLPLSHHLEQLLDIGGRLQKSTPAFLAGAYSNNGWWYYFPIAFLLKTPQPTLITLLVASFSLLWLAAKRHLNGRWLTLLALLVPAVGYFAFALTTDINLGYRHILPVLPFLIVFIAVALAWLTEFSRSWRALPQLALVGFIGLARLLYYLALPTLFGIF